MGRGKKRQLASRGTVVRGQKLANLHELRSHPLLERCGSDPGKQPKYGDFIWAKAIGSCYWPAIVSRAEADEHEEKTDLDEPTQFAFVMFIESRFRLSAMQWSRIIPVDLDNIETQTTLITELNELESHKKSHQQCKAFKESCELLKQFEAIPPLERQEAAIAKCSEYLNKNKPAVKRRRSKSVEKTSSPQMPLLRPIAPLPEVPDISDENLPRRGTPRLSSAYKFRPTINAVKAWDTSLARNEPKSSSAENSDAASTSTNGSVSKKKAGRPTEGDELRKWTDEKFKNMDKHFRFDSKDIMYCSKCQEILSDPASIEKCHDLKFHRTCLQQVPAVQVKDGKSVLASYKCEDCLGQRCAACHKESADGEEAPHKCSKCDLRFHRDCLVFTWPQGEVVGTTGPITCPLHFCHTCKGEHKSSGKVRNFKLTACRSMRCIYCFSSYHRGTCIPAGSGSTIMEGQFLICPRHSLNESQGRQKKVKKLGCFTCMKRILNKEESINCNFCPFYFHKDCVYTDAQIKFGISVEKYQADFKCESCIWGMFPIYGQVVWFQQPGSTYWPSLVMYPKDSAAMTSSLKSVGAFGVSYCGFANPLSYPNGFYHQAIPIEIGSKDFLKRLNFYDNPKVESAAKEAYHLMKLSEIHRDSLLPPPEPVYKKIDKNIIRILTSKGRTSCKTKVATDKEDMCPCGKEDTTGDVCTLQSSCFNRATHAECTDATCSGGTRCRNRMFSTKLDQLDHMLEYFISSTSKGWGLRTKVGLKKGTFVIEYVGEVIDKKEVFWRVERKVDDEPLYFLELDGNTFIDAEYVGNLSRLINHSCDPNCKTEKYTSAYGKLVVGIFAARDIALGEELSFDYNYGTDQKIRFKCRCKSSNCKGHIGRYEENEENLIPGERVSRNANANADWKWEDECTICGTGGEVLMCDYPDCPKSYHMSCLGIETTPRGAWICPTHSEEKDDTGRSVPSEPPQKKARLSQKVKKVAPASSATSMSPDSEAPDEAQTCELLLDPPAQSQPLVPSPVMANETPSATRRTNYTFIRQRAYESVEVEPGPLVIDLTEDDEVDPLALPIPILTVEDDEVSKPDDAPVEGFSLKLLRRTLQKARECSIF